MVKAYGIEDALLELVLPFQLEVVLEQQPVDVIAEVRISIFSKPRLIDRCAVGKNMCDLALVDLPGVSRPMNERVVAQTARVCKQVAHGDLFGQRRLELNASRVFCHRIGKFDLSFLIEHRRHHRRERFGCRAHVPDRIRIGLEPRFFVGHTVGLGKDRLVVFDHDERNARYVGDPFEGFDDRRVECSVEITRTIALREYNSGIQNQND